MRIITLVAVLAVVTIGLGGALFLAGGRLNTSSSMPLGLYWITDKPMTKGEYVIFCPPLQTAFKEAKRRGYIGFGLCPGNYSYMMKKIVTLQGDNIAITAQGVSVNDTLLPHTTPLPTDRAGQPLPQISIASYTLSESELLLMTEHSPTSFDSRYFGPVNKTQIVSVIRPVLTSSTYWGQWFLKRYNQLKNSGK
ncbi:conjugative transfer signal peptidase TraF [Candidatus Regiella insecticola 5.15]|uniref:Conjugative transfer signal peptidase TraF n=1 Tax=Candidatus Regiella insecticola 5.15 TaxID=1005043 RepID=G2GW86_9ENTR|nr:conjugative transfer signal peptidase TraF [Candidatus Regiella insecticola]EGY29990.1 conjugative transfer signal peptidase TraF [Candidatus Regiella insecticola 5.15]